MAEKRAISVIASEAKMRIDRVQKFANVKDSAEISRLVLQESDVLNHDTAPTKIVTFSTLGSSAIKPMFTGACKKLIESCFV